MKALSIMPDYTMDIFMGEKTVEYRTWQTDYRGDLLICASSKKMQGYVCGYAYFVIPLLDIMPDRKNAQYDWILGAPKLIRPIPVKGKLHLFDVDDALIQYVEGGDLGAYQTKKEVNAFRTGYIKQYLDQLAYNTKGGRTGVQTVNIRREYDKIFDYYGEWKDQIIGSAFLREPFCPDFKKKAGLTDDVAFLEAFKAFMEVEHKVFRWKNDYLETRTTAEEAFREFYKKQNYDASNLEESCDLFIISFLNQYIDECQYEWEDEHPKEEIPQISDDDIDTLYLASVFSVQKCGEEEEAFCKSIGITYHAEQLHTCCWFAEQINSDKDQIPRESFSARNAYNRLQSPSTLLWIGVVMGIDRAVLKTAAEEMAAKKGNAAKSNIVRKYVPFDAILEQFNRIMAEEE